MPFERTGLFAGLSDEDLAELLAAGERDSIGADAAVFENGDRGDAMYVVLSGEARVDVGGRFHILKAGDFFGEIAVIAPGPRMATVRAVTGLEVLRIPADRFEPFLLSHPSVGLSMMRFLAVRLREVEQRLDAWMA
jgi:CRP-like cAMP-binding protein